MQVPNASPVSLAALLLPQNFLSFLFDNFELSTEQTGDNNTIKEEFGGSDAYE
jgi:hypothetical protein